MIVIFPYQIFFSLEAIFTYPPPSWHFSKYIPLHQGVLFKCEECNYSATSRQYLEMHKDSKHDGMMYPCDLCEYIAKEAGSLRKHETCKQCFGSGSGIFSGHRSGSGSLIFSRIRIRGVKKEPKFGINI